MIAQKKENYCAQTIMLFALSYPRLLLANPTFIPSGSKGSLGWGSMEP